ncbi:hypothetical protein, partial [Pseudoflavonifractor phocaeensis]|uniref:hypothetical protein n=1 Tax=Pseudoflavonifractor phocaeensis TaxID=1870988 RepID=UPI00195C1CD3
ALLGNAVLGVKHIVASNACGYPNATCCLLRAMPPNPVERRILFCGYAFFERFFVSPEVTIFCL